MVPQSNIPSSAPAKTEFSERLALVSDCLQSIEAACNNSDKSLNLTEKTALQRAKQQLEKLELNNRAKDVDPLASLSAEDEEFSQKFLDVFTSEAFSQDLDMLRQTEGENMSDSDFSTLADSIKSLGLGMTPENRKLFNRYLESRS